MSDEVPPPPPKHATTTQLPREDVLSGLLTKLQQTMTDGFAGVDQRLDNIERNVDLVKGQAQSLEGRMGLLEQRQFSVEQRQDNGSIRAGRLSEVDAKHDENFAAVFLRLDAQDVAQAENTKKTELAVLAAEQANKKTEAVARDVITIKDAVVGVVTSPKVRMLGKVIFSLAMAYAAAKGIKVVP